jgi:hypothetical protein
MIKITIESRLVDLLEQWLYKLVRPGRPGQPVVHVTSQGPNNMLKFKVHLPAFDAANPNDDDVVTRKLTTTVGSGTPVLTDSPATDTEVVNDLFVGNAGDVVSLSLVDVDGSGNVSSPSVATFTLVDTIAPPTPGVLSGEVTGQV